MYYFYYSLKLNEIKINEYKLNEIKIIVYYKAYK